jgi:hypothetical protein
MDLACTRLSFKLADLSAGHFYVGTSEGEVVGADFTKTDSDDNPDYARFETRTLAPSIVLQCITRRSLSAWLHSVASVVVAADIRLGGCAHLLP